MSHQHEANDHSHGTGANLSADAKERRKNNLINSLPPVPVLPMGKAWTLTSSNGFGGSIRLCLAWTSGCVGSGPGRKRMPWAGAA